MKSLYGLQAFWLVVAVGAYVVGTLKRDRPGAGSSSTAVTVITPQEAVEASERRPALAVSDPEGARNGASPGSATPAPLREDEIESVAKDAFTDPNPVKRQLAFARLLQGLTPENAALIRDQMRGNRANGDQWRLFQYAWGAADGQGALAAAAKIENKENRAGALSQALSGWASADPSTAIAWLGQIENPDEKNQLQASLVGGLADHDIGIASRYVMDLAAAGDPRAASHMETVASEQLRKEGPEGAARWAESLPAGDLKGAALGRVATSYVANNPEAAAAWASQFAAVDYGVRAVAEVGEEWAEQNPTAAVTWLQGLGDGKAKSDGMYSALGEWARRDPTAASQYLVDMPQSPLKDTAVHGFVRRVAWEDPESAIAWARSIAQESTRRDAMTRAAQAWFIRDREAALQWLPSSGLPPEAQKRVLETKANGRRGRG